MRKPVRAVGRIMTGGIVLAGSHIWNDGSFESLCPRLLLPVANDPLVSHILTWFRRGGVRRVTICANEGAEVLEETLGDGTQYGVELTYCVDRLPRGPAGCVHDAAMVTPADFYVVVEGSIIPGIDLAPVLRAQAKNGAALTIVVNDADEEEECFGSRMSPAGIYIFSPRACEVIPTTGYQDIKEMLVPQLRRKDGVVSAYFAAEPSPRINHLEWYLAAQGWILQKLGSGGPPSGGYRQLDGSYIHRRAYVADDACIVGPVMVGPNARVEQESVILGPSVIGNGSVIGDQSVVKHSVIWDHCSVGERAEVDRCLMISGASVPAGDVRFNKVCRPQVVGDGSQGTDHGRR